MRLVLGILVMAMASVCYGQASKSNSSSLFGCYVQSHKTLVYTGTNSEWQLVEDYLGIRSKSKSEVEFELEIVRENGHVCGASGTARLDRVGNRQVVKMIPQPRPEYAGPDFKTCSLSILIRANSFHVETEGDCHEHFMCGARAHLDGAEISRRHRKALTKDVPCFRR